MLHHVAMSAHQPPRAAVSMAKTGERRRVGRRHPASRLAYRFMERRIWIQQGQPRFSFSSVVGRESPSELEGKIRDVVLISRAFHLAPFGPDRQDLVAFTRTFPFFREQLDAGCQSRALELL